MQRVCTNRQYVENNCSHQQNTFFVKRDRKEESADERFANEGSSKATGFAPLGSLKTRGSTSSQAAAGAGAGAKIKANNSELRSVYFLDPLPLNLGDDESNREGQKYSTLRRAQGADAKTGEVTDKIGSIKIAPKIGPADRLPIEIVDLTLEDEETATDAKTGIVRLWVDMTYETDDYKQAVLLTAQVPFEVRIVIRHAKNISVFKDVGERNDALVQGRLKVKDFSGIEAVHRVETDVHKWAGAEAAWNWRWIFQVVAPTSFCSLQLSLMDSDTMSDDDPIYDPKEYPLDHLIMLAWQSRRDGEPPLGRLSESMIFDTWPNMPIEGKKGGCCSCRCCSKKQKPNSKRNAKLFFDIQVMAQDEADANKVENNVRVGGEPKGRMGWSTAIKEPKKFIHVLLGPTLEKKCLMNIAALSCVTVFVLVIMSFFFISQGTAGITR